MFSKEIIIDTRLTEGTFQKVLEATPSIIKSYVGLSGLSDRFYKDFANEAEVKTIEDFNSKINSTFNYNQKDYGNIVEAIEALIKSEEFVVVEDINSLIDVRYFLKGLKEAQNHIAFLTNYINSNKEGFASALNETFKLHENEIVREVFTNSGVFSLRFNLDELSSDIIQGRQSIDSVIEKFRKEFVEEGCMKAKDYKDYSLKEFQNHFDSKKADTRGLMSFVLYFDGSDKKKV